MPRRLSKLRVDEISTVDKGAGVGTQIKFWKRDDVERFYRKIFGVPPTPGDALRDSLKKAAVNPRLQDLEDEEADDGDRAGDDGEEADDDTDETVPFHELREEDLPSGESLAEDFERFLRDQRDEE